MEIVALYDPWLNVFGFVMFTKHLKSEVILRFIQAFVA